MKPPKIEVISHVEAAAFGAMAVPFLQSAEALNTLPLRIVRDVIAGRATSERRLWTVHRGANLVGIALRTPPYNLVLSEPFEEVEALLEEVQDERLPGVIGPNRQTRDFADAWTRRHGGVWKVSMELRIFDAVRAFDWPATPGDWRLAKEADLPLLTRWTEAFHDEADPDNPAREKPRGPDGFYLWSTDAGEVVTMVYAGEATAEAAFITQVYTPPEHRRHGYATAAVGAATRHLLSGAFKRCYLFTDLSNPVSNSIYPKVGYRQVGDYLNLLFDDSP